MGLKFIILNGPPGSGKDTIADALCKNQQLKYRSDFIFKEKFAAPLKMIIPHIYDLTLDQFRVLDAPANKDRPHTCFKGKTTREVQIALSELYFKPLHGPAIFGELLVNRCEGWLYCNQIDPKFSNVIVVVSDGGFIPEFDDLVTRYGDQNVQLVRLMREGHQFEGDSRSYIPDFPGKYTGQDVQNVTGELDAAVNFIVRLPKVESWLRVTD